MHSLNGRLSSMMAATHAAGRLRRRRVVESRLAGTARARIDGREVLVFCSNDYLGLAGDTRVGEALAQAARRWGLGSGASHLVSGHSREHHALEEELADFLGRPRALLFSTGYMANLAVGSALLQPGDRVIEDRLNHASLLDAGRLSGCHFARYPHGDVPALERELSVAHEGATLVVTDGVFSMDGDLAPLTALADTCRRRDAWLFVDDAHGFGVLGSHGRGSVELEGLDPQDVPVLMCTLGKAVGAFGAVVAGSEDLVEVLIQRARTYMFTTGLPPAVAAATRVALRLCRAESWRRERLGSLIERFRREAGTLGLRLLDSRTPIQPILIGEERAAVAASEALLDAGLWIAAIRPPAVPKGSSRLRITLSAVHTDADLDRLMEELSRLARRGLLA
jgi:8-amino-7-oxononanoate synthase